MALPNDAHHSIPAPTKMVDSPRLISSESLRSLVLDDEGSSETIDTDKLLEDPSSIRQRSISPDIVPFSPSFSPKLLSLDSDDTANDDSDVGFFEGKTFYLLDNCLRDLGEVQGNLEEMRHEFGPSPLFLMI